MMTAVIFMALLVLDFLLQRGEEHLDQEIQSWLKKGVELGRKGVQKTFRIDAEGEELTEEVVMKLVMILIASFGVRGIMGEGFNRHGTDIGPLGTTWESLAISAFATLALDRTKLGVVSDGFRSVIDEVIGVVKKSRAKKAK